MMESLLALWACGREPAEDLDRIREDPALALLLGHKLPAAHAARNFLSRFEAPDLPLLSAPGHRGLVRQESAALSGLWQANRAILADVQAHAPQKVATLDIGGTVLASSKRAAKATYDGRRGYQPAVALRAEQDLILAKEFRGGNVSPASGNERVIERALAALSEEFHAIRPNRLRYLVLNTLGKIVSRAGERLLKRSTDFARHVLDTFVTGAKLRAIRR